MGSRLWGLGRNQDGQLMNTTKINANRPKPAGPAKLVQVAGAEKETPLPVKMFKELAAIEDVACGMGFSLVLLSNGTVFSGGLNHMGQLGHGNADLTDRVRVQTAESGDGRLLRRNAVGHGKEKENPHGPQSGEGESILEPRQVASLAAFHVIQVACGKAHTLVLTDDGAYPVFSFGSNLNGECGLGNGEIGLERRCRHMTVPTLITTLVDKSIVRITCGAHASFGITTHGALFSWGNNAHGQLVLGHAQSTDCPQKSPWLGQHLCVQVSSGAFHTLLLTHSGKVFSCGRNARGLLGTGLRGGPAMWTTPQLLEPLLGKNVLQVFCGISHSAALGFDQDANQRRLYTWGHNSHGQLGHFGVAFGAEVHRATLVDTLRSKDVVSVALGNFHMIVVTSENEIYSWGDNRYSQLGVDSRVVVAAGGMSAKTSLPLPVPRLVRFGPSGKKKGTGKTAVASFKSGQGEVRERIMRAFSSSQEEDDDHFGTDDNFGEAGRAPQVDREAEVDKEAGETDTDAGGGATSLGLASLRGAERFESVNRIGSGGSPTIKSRMYSPRAEETE
ncbi:regulator of chromosome condensation 1/beta-lactamase-inhibitor protein II, partial [Baffinella frigidus]